MITPLFFRLIKNTMRCLIRARNMMRDTIAVHPQKKGGRIAAELQSCLFKSLIKKATVGSVPNSV